MRKSKQNVLRSVGISAALWLGVLLPSAGDAQSLLSTPSPGGILMDGKGLVKSVVARRATQPQLQRGRFAVSLVHLSRWCRREGIQATDELPASMRWLGGLTSIDYVLLLRERGSVKDILLIGKRSPDSRTLCLDDFLQLRLRADSNTSCSIEPTRKGIRAWEKLTANVRVWTPELGAELIEAMGPQQIKFKGIKPGSRVAHLLLAADVRFKQIAMGQIRSGVRGMPSYLQQTRRALANHRPQWWITCAPVTLTTNPAMTFWALPRLTFRVEGEDKAEHPEVEQWARLATKHYDQLEKQHDAILRIRSQFRWKLVHTLLRKLESQHDFQTKLLLEDLMALRPQKYAAPQSIATTLVTRRRRRGWLVAASGGVQIPNWKLEQFHVAFEEIKQDNWEPANWFESYSRLPKRKQNANRCSWYEYSGNRSHLDYGYPNETSSRNGQTICLLVDRSGSMRQSPLNLASVFKRHFGGQCDQNTFYVLAFCDTVRLWKAKPIPMSLRNQRSAIRWLASLPCKGGTGYLKAIRHAHSLGPDEIVLVSDGAASSQGMQWTLQAMRQRRLRRIPVDTICTSETIAGQTLLGSISLLTHGRVLRK